MKYKVRVYCRYCVGEDFMGCFDGGYEDVESDTSPYVVRWFDDKAEAFEAGDVAVADCTPWGFIVVDENGEEVEE